jgi:hypothetical protein
VADPEHVSLTWWADHSVSRATLERAAGTGAAWSTVASLETDAGGRLRYEDRDVVAGARYGYRLRLVRNDADVVLPESWVSVPAAFVLALDGVRPNPSRGDLTVSFVAPVAGQVGFEVLDVAGRRVFTRRYTVRRGERSLAITLRLRRLI